MMLRSVIAFALVILLALSAFGLISYHLVCAVVAQDAARDEEILYSKAALKHLDFILDRIKLRNAYIQGYVDGCRRMPEIQ